MPLDVTPEMLEKISACAEIGNTIEQTATLLSVHVDELVKLFSENAEARDRWERGGLEAIGQLKQALTRAALAGSFQSAKLLLQLRGADKPEKNAPVFSTPTTSPTNDRRGAAWRWKKIADVAGELQVSAQYIRNMTRDAVHPLAFEKHAGEWTVKAGEAYEWICKHAKRRPPNLVEPKGYAEPKEIVPPAPATTGTGADDELAADLDVLAILNRAYNSLAAPADKMADVAVARELRQKVMADLKREKMVHVKDVVKILRGFGDLLVDMLESNAEPLSIETIKTLRDRVDGDINNPATPAVLTSMYCDQANRVFIPAIRQRVRDEVDGVQALQLGGSE